MIVDTDLYNIAIEAWARTSGQKGRQDEEWKKLSHYYSNNNVHESSTLSMPSNNTSSLPFAAIRAQNILYKMEESELDASLNAKPDVKSYFLVLKAWVRSKEECSLEKMEEILLLLDEYIKSNQHRKATRYHDLMTTVQCYNLYLYSLANKKTSLFHMEHAEKAHTILLNLRCRSQEANCNHENGMPDVNTYNQVMSAYARTRSLKGASQAQAILDDMMKEANSTNVYPNTDTFNAVMGCWLKSGSRKASYHIEYILNLMNGLNEDVLGYQDACPDIYSVNTAIASIARSGRKDSLRRAHYILSNMDEIYGVKPNSLSYNLLIDAYGKSQDIRAVEEAERLLSTMEMLYIGGNEEVMPDSFSYSTVIDTISSRMKNSAGRKAESILNQMTELNKEHGGVKPNVAVYNVVMNCYACHSDKKTVQRLEAILRFLEVMEKTGNSHLKPNIISFNTVLKGYANAKENLSHKAEQLLDRMENEKAVVDPDVISYTTVISAYGRSTAPGKAKNAKRVLDRMVQRYKDETTHAPKPNIYSFNACLNACAFTFNRADKIDAFVVVMDTLILIQQFAKPDHTTYGTVLKAWRNLIPKHDDRRQAVVISCFRQCRKEGLVGQNVLRELQLAASPEVYRQLVDREISDDIKVTLLPSRWSRNVKDRINTRNAPEQKQF